MTDTFQNLSVNISELPEVKHSTFFGIEQKYLSVTLIVTGVTFLVLMVGAGCIVYFSDEIDNGLTEFGLALVPLLLLWIGSSLYSIKAFARKRYSLREKDIIYCKNFANSFLFQVHQWKYFTGPSTFMSLEL